VTDRSLITTGAIGAVLAAICCATPLLAVVVGGHRPYRLEDLRQTIFAYPTGASDIGSML
jgi:hypothetical protein